MNDKPTISFLTWAEVRKAGYGRREKGSFLRRPRIDADLPAILSILDPHGTGGEDTLAMNERDWLDCMRTRPPCEVEDGHRVSIACHLASMSLRRGRSIPGILRWKGDR